MKNKKFEEKKIKLKGRTTQEYFIDPKGPIAEFKRDKKIYVNKDFLKLSPKEKQVVVYHERGHLKMSNYLFFEISNIFLLIFGFSIAYLIVNSVLKLVGYRIPFDINFSINIFLIIFSLVSICSFRWLSEIICDFNSIRNLGKNQTIKTIGEIYKKEKFHLWNHWVLHPPWKLRKKIMEELD